MAGFIKLHRGWRECEVFRDEPLTERESWLWLLENAAWKDTTRKAGKGNVVSIERGQIHTSERTLAAAWRWDRKRVKRFLKRLENARMMTPQMGPDGTTITICNYEKYQGDGANQGTKKGANQGTTQKEDKEIKENRDSDFAFCGDVVRLNAADFQKWQAAYPDLDLRAMLTGRDAYLAGRPMAERKRWFLSTSTWLANKQQSVKAAEKHLEWVSPC